MVNSSQNKSKFFHFLRQLAFFLFPLKKSPINTRQFFLKQICFLLPLFISVAVLSFYCGSEEPVNFFKHSRESNGILYHIMVTISLGNNVGYALYALCFIWALLKKKTLNVWFVFYYLAMQAIVGVCSVYVLKISVGRPRPFTGENEYQFFSLENEYHSFPSGHVAEICGAIGPFAQRVYSLACAFLWGILPAAIGVSRIYLGDHHRTDVLAGSIIGSMTTYAIMYFWLLKKEQLEKKSFH